MPVYTNTIKGFRYSPYRGSSVKNCASCSAAGVFNLIAGSCRSNSAEAVKSGGKGMMMGDSTTTQAQTIADVVSASTNRSAQSTDGELSLVDAENWMRSKPDKTVFAILASGYVPHDSENKCHWLNAILASGVIRYFDFQTNRESKSGGQFTGNANPASCSKPFVGVITQSQNGASSRDLHSSNQVGIFDAEVKLNVLAFAP